MPAFLILRLQGPMQAWGKHTFETTRPSELFPTRSGLIGLLGACLGIDRSATTDLKALSDKFTFAVRADDDPERPVRRITDFHTILHARLVTGKAGEKNPVVSRREYLCDARFTVALEFKPNARYGLDTIRNAVRRPFFTPFLGRRSCPLTRPLLDKDVGVNGVVDASDLLDALAKVPPKRGTIYTEGMISPNRLVVRDVPLFGRTRQFTTRDVFIHAPSEDVMSDP